MDEVPEEVEHPLNNEDGPVPTLQQCLELCFPLPKTMFELEDATAKIRRFRDKTPLPFQGDPLSWSREHEQEYSQLSRAAAFPVYSDERVFYTGMTEKHQDSWACRPACLSS